MELELDCTWNQGRNKAKQIIHFTFRPKSLFVMPEDQIATVQSLARAPHLQGPPALEKLASLSKKFSRSPYVLMMYYQTLRFFEYFEEASDCYDRLRSQFSESVFVKSLVGEELLQNKNYEGFSNLFNGIEVLKGAFPKRRNFYFEEALFFHSIWARYFHDTKNIEQSQKHQKLFLMILDLSKRVRSQIVES